MFFRLFEKEEKSGFFLLKETVFDGTKQIDKEKFVLKKLCFVLHGWGANSLTYKSLYVDLLERVDGVVALDFPGLGCEKLNKSFTLDDFANYLKTVFDLFESDDVCFLCHSFGARVFFVFYDAFEECCSSIKKLILLAPAGIKHRFSIVRFLKVKKFKHLVKKCKKYPHLCEKLAKFGSNDYKNIKTSCLRETFKNVVRVDNVAFAKKIKIPTIIIWGRNDRDVKKYMVKKLARLISSSQLFVIRDAGHFAFLDKRHEVSLIIKKFLS